MRSVGKARVAEGALLGHSGGVATAAVVAEPVVRVGEVAGVPEDALSLEVAAWRVSLGRDGGVATAVVAEAV